MVDVAVHLERRVLPEAPVRHWTCSLPWSLRSLLGYDRRLCADVVRAFATTLMAALRRRAKRELGLASVRDAHAGLVVAVQRTDGALRLNVHLHVIALDGVYVRDERGTLVFRELAPPTRDDVADVAARTAAKLDRVLARHGRRPRRPTALAPRRLPLAVTRQRARRTRPVAEVRGVNVHARRLRPLRRLRWTEVATTRPPNGCSPSSAETSQPRHPPELPRARRRKRRRDRRGSGSGSEGARAARLGGDPRGRARATQRATLRVLHRVGRGANLRVLSFRRWTHLTAPPHVWSVGAGRRAGSRARPIRARMPSRGARRSRRRSCPGASTASRVTRRPTSGCGG